MPVNPTYPGVYIEELPSGVRTIAGVPTSVTAFVGRTLRGPIDEPITLNNYGDYERTFGGLSMDSTVSFAVRDYFRNGGGTALVVRVVNAATAATFELEEAGTPLITLEAADPGTWANAVTVTLDTEVSSDVADRYGVAVSDLFNLTITDAATGTAETHRNLTLVDSPRRIDRVLEQDSDMVRLSGPMPSVIPSPQTVGTASAGDDGTTPALADFEGSRANKTGIYALEKADIFNILCIPPYDFVTDVDPSLLTTAGNYAAERRAMLIVDPPMTWNELSDLDIANGTATAVPNLAAITGAVGSNRKNAALYFPRLIEANPLRDNQLEAFAPCGAVAGIYSRTDAQRGVWKAPAGIEAAINGAPLLEVPLTDDENGQINPLGVNALRSRPGAGNVVWGARTLAGDDRLASEWKYVPVRRIALYIEESLYRGTQWAVFEPNDEPLWAQIRVSIGAFMQNLFRQGAFQGQRKQDAYFVKVDRETTTQNDIDRGIVNIVVGFAPLKPAEFVVIKLQQIAGQTEA